MIKLFFRFCWQTTQIIGGLFGAVVLITLLVIWASSYVPKKHSQDDRADDEDVAVVNLAMNGHELSESIMPRHPLNAVSSQDGESQQDISLQPTSSFKPSLAIDQRAREAFEQRRKDQSAWQTVHRQPSLATAPYQRRAGNRAGVAVVDTQHEVHFVKESVAATELAVTKPQLSLESSAPVEVAQLQPVLNLELPQAETTEVEKFRSIVQEITTLPAPSLPAPPRTAKAWETGRY